jgi:hypothetical protein
VQIRTALLGAVLAVAAGVAPAHAAKSVALYLAQVSTDCNAPVFVIVPDSAGTTTCVYLPRASYQGTGVDNTAEAFASGRRAVYRIDASRKLTGTFALFATSGIAPPEDGAGLVAGDLTIKIARKTVGTVHVEGPSAPGQPAVTSFSLTIPASLNKVRTDAVSVTVAWSTCVAPAGCGVKLNGPSHSRFVLPVR